MYPESERLRLAELATSAPKGYVHLTELPPGVVRPLWYAHESNFCPTLHVSHDGIVRNGNQPEVHQLDMAYSEGLCSLRRRRRKGDVAMLAQQRIKEHHQQQWGKPELGGVWSYDDSDPLTGEHWGRDWDDMQRLRLEKASSMRARPSCMRVISPLPSVRGRGSGVTALRNNHHVMYVPLRCCTALRTTLQDTHECECTRVGGSCW